MMHLIQMRFLKQNKFGLSLLTILICICLYVQIRSRGLITECQKMQDIIKTKAKLEKHCEALIILESKLQKQMKDSLDQLSKSWSDPDSVIQKSNAGMDELVKDYIENIKDIEIGNDTDDDPTNTESKDISNVAYDLTKEESEYDQDAPDVENDNQDSHVVGNQNKESTFVENDNQDTSVVENQENPDVENNAKGNPENTNDSIGSSDTHKTNDINEDNTKHILTPLGPSETYKNTYSNISQLQQRYPNAIIIGMPKCGTDALRTSMMLNPM
ncbi:unnamed protein product, partial [Owenia fusiformis]